MSSGCTSTPTARVRRSPLHFSTVKNTGNIVFAVLRLRASTASAQTEREESGRGATAAFARDETERNANVRHSSRDSHLRLLPLDPPRHQLQFPVKKPRVCIFSPFKFFKQ